MIILLLNIFIMMELIKLQYAINASMHYQRNGLKDILKMFIKSWYTIHFSFIANRNSLMKNKLHGLTNGLLKMKSKLWTNVKSGKQLLIFCKLRFLALKLLMPVAVLHATLWAFDLALSWIIWKQLIHLLKMQSFWIVMLNWCLWATFDLIGKWQIIHNLRKQMTKVYWHFKSLIWSLRSWQRRIDLDLLVLIISW